MISLSSTLYSQEIFVPKQFENGQIIDQIILISDVDGVVREGLEAAADVRVIEECKSLLKNWGVDITFISGTPIENDLSTDFWRRGNLPLSKVFGSSFNQELIDGRVAIYGVLGGHSMNADGTLEVADEYSPDISYELGKLLIHVFLKEVLQHGNDEQRLIARKLQIKLKALDSHPSSHSANLTGEEFYPIIREIHEHLDPDFRLISNGALIETQTSNPPWSTALSSQCLKEELNQQPFFIDHLSPSQKQIATGLVKRAGKGFNYLLICKTNKGLTTKKHIEEKLQNYPNALVVTIGDTQVDFPMHQNAHLAFHVGLEEVWLNHPLPQCMMVRDSEGKDAQHVKGTLQVLKLLKEAIGKSFFDLKYIPRCDSSGQWNYYSIQEIQS